MRLLNLAAASAALEQASRPVVYGKVVRATGLVVEAAMPRVAVGTGCDIVATDARVVPAEVVGFTGPTALLMLLGDMRGIADGCPVIPRGRLSAVPVGDELLGRIVDPFMRPVDGGPPPRLDAHADLDLNPPIAMTRRRISQVMPTGVRALDTLLTVGEGQRLGIMAGPGVGKSVLLGMLARSAEAEVIVVGLIGERGREVREFVERDLGPGISRSVVVVATSDEPPLVRLRAGMAATSVAEHFRAQGKRVLLLVDSLSRICMAQREVGLAAGEPPTSKGYPPSVFAMLPRLVERAGNGSARGSITALYTVLAEGDDQADPVVDAAKAALDGHIVLSRKLASSGHFPAIDVLPSVSRVMTEVVTPEHLKVALQVRDLLSAYQESSDLIEVGAYVSGTNPRVDRALRTRQALTGFLRQGPDERIPLDQSLTSLERIVSEGGRK
jgi:flagellum-specific ATP synthase